MRGNVGYKELTVLTSGGDPMREIKSLQWEMNDVVLFCENNGKASYLPARIRCMIRTVILLIEYDVFM